jgi:GT2 family glycosyltransferase
MSERDWTVITVTFNSAAQLRHCWSSWPVGAARWIVVDNCSSDDSTSVAASLGAEVISLPTNVGFGAANNRALREVSSAWTLFANPDVVLDATTLPRLARTAESNDSLVAPQLLDPDGTPQPNARGLPHLADKISNRLLRARAQHAGYTNTDLDRPTWAAWAMGAALGGSTASFRELGGWDERYFIYYEDHDIGLRSWLGGHGLVIDPDVRWHHEWQRATTLPRLAPWTHELHSMRTFYRTYPDLLTRGRSRRSARWETVRERLWQPALTPAGA